MRAYSISEVKESELYQLFSTYPDGWSGIGLLLLRLAIGSITVVQGKLYLAPFQQRSGSVLIVAISAIAIGLLMLVGFLTALSAALTAACTIHTAISWAQLFPSNSLETGVLAVLVVVVSAAISFLGPGAFSVDARLFGRREIIIPLSPRQPRS